MLEGRFLETHCSRSGSEGAKWLMGEERLRILERDGEVGSAWEHFGRWRSVVASFIWAGSGTETVPWYESGGDFDGSSWFVGSTKEEESNEGLARERFSGETNMCWMMALRAPK